MKTPTLLLVGLIVALVATASAAGPVNVTASRSLRIALVDTRTEPSADVLLPQEFGRRFERAVSRIYGAETPLELIPVTAAEAARGLHADRFDAAVVFAVRAPAALRRGGLHAIRGTPGEDRSRSQSFLVIRREQPELDSVLANAFNVAVTSEAVRQMLAGRELALAGGR